MPFRLTVEGFNEGDVIPRQHTCEGPDTSPALRWEGAPGQTRSFALIMDDPDAPVGTWNHWLLWNIPADTTNLAAGYRAGDVGIDGVNDFGRTGYGGPCPPKGHGPHRYFFKLYALDLEVLGAKPKAKRIELDIALRGHVLEEAQYIGRYERR
ncbi:MAG: YbhB/YbcL family Raf kinase inhibitor-like protein [Bryobacteraceae bacterium]|nr:YbhB/YbcL family Raf kinase inhibitor-like protein [Bryobacteraceae bacterium]